MRDAISPRGLETEKSRLDALEIFYRRKPEFRIVLADNNSHAQIRGLIYRSVLRDEHSFMQMEALAIIKVRDVRLAIFQNDPKWQNELLITAEKIDNAIAVSEIMCLPICVLIYFKNDATVLGQTFYVHRRKWIVPVRYADTVTKETVNSDTCDKQRTNAFISMEGAEKME
jgi:hypothetical protein